MPAFGPRYWSHMLVTYLIAQAVFAPVFVACVLLGLSESVAVVAALPGMAAVCVWRQRWSVVRHL